jgi:hypothetical protein
VSFSARTGRTAALAAVVGFGCLAAFQLALALGAPLGHAAWGGSESHLSTGERVGSAISVVFYCAAAWVVLGRAGLTGDSRRLVFSRGTWFLAVVFALSALMNFASQSSWERSLLGPTAALLAILCVVVARTPPVERHGRRRTAGGAVVGKRG